ncbi:MAG TPA: protein-glutamate O-methyltransferase CheR [Acidisoma sp.]|uniref:protein-glutamate O-methyltransferase CheR n=1 Tax=Acidisoma sp. TaxID=1872115 RepID=UPI002CE5EF8C|nr:protein-glutamate O-methyltransferase CheR [Acidisoma sp.]HTI02470.1 protein-glutamate O-methyltransferase CheR [Acidisoma sp.]
MPGSSARREADESWRKGAFAELKQAIIARTGHHYYIDKDHLLRDRLQRRLAAVACPDAATYLALLADPRRGPAEWQELEAEITVGETFFFRHAEQFAALRDTILPALIQENRRSRRLRIWSAGCAVGAEPYSLAILLERMLGPGLPDWTIEILGSDLNARALAMAREGVFTEWAMRGMAAADRKRDFTALPDRRHWRIADRHRRRVRFVQHNLLSLLEPGGAAGWAEFDLILCRNVLIYFSSEKIAPMLSALACGLSPAGWLMVGHSDAIAALPRDLRTVELSGTTAFRLPTASHSIQPWLPRPPADGLAPISEPKDQLDLDLPRLELMAQWQPWPDAAAPDPAAPEQAAPEPGAPEPGAPEPAVPSLAAIRAFADSGQLRAAAMAAEAAIAANPLDARMHFYDGVIAQAAGDRLRAEAALRRAVYLCGHMVMAHYHLGLALIDGGEREAGRRRLALVLRLCADLPDGSLLAEGDGLTARDLEARVHMQLRPGPR